MMPIGEMDRVVVIEQPTKSKNSFNEDVLSWSTLATVWAKAEPARSLERFTAGQRRASKVYRFTIWFRTDVTEEMRIVHDSVKYQILGIVEVGRNEGLEITAESLEKHAEG